MAALQPDWKTDGDYFSERLASAGTGFFSPAALESMGPNSGFYDFDVAALITPHPEAVPPRADITFLDQLDDDTATVTLYRQAGGRQMPVRGAQELYAVGGVTAVDEEVPLGIPTTYFAAQFDADGVFLGNTVASAITVTGQNAGKTWVQNPFDPAGAIPVRTAVATAAQVQAVTPTTVYYPAGRRAGVGISSQRQGLQGIPLVFYTDTLEQADAFDAMFGAVDGTLGLPPYLVVRFAEGFITRLPQPLNVAVPNPTHGGVNTVARGTVIQWTVNGNEIDPPAPILSATLLSMDDLDAFYPSMDAMDAAYDSMLAADRDYTLAGYADANS